jgi:flagellin-like protein
MMLTIDRGTVQECGGIYWKPAPCITRVTHCHEPSAALANPSLCKGCLVVVYSMTRPSWGCTSSSMFRLIKKSLGGDTKKMNTTRRSLKKDEKAVSPVIGVIMMIAIVVIIAAVVAAFAYGIIGGVKKAPSTALVVEGAKVSTDATNVTIFHHGGDTITEAFSSDVGNITIGTMWDNLEVRLNGAEVTGSVANFVEINGVNCTDNTKTSFEPGDQLKINFASLSEGDALVILHEPSDNILQRITIS